MAKKALTEVKWTAKLRDSWAASLESGRYRQGRETLKTDDGEYCCLGVLARICGVRRDSVILTNNCDFTQLVDIHENAWHANKDLNGGRLEPWEREANKAIIFNSMKLPTLPKKIERRLVNANDEERLDFKAIAKIIRGYTVKQLNGEK